MDKPKSVWRFLFKLGMFLLIVVGFVGMFAWYRLTPVKKAGGLLVTIGKETTYITSPLRPDGYPDYVGALNELLSKDVTPENNAVALLVEAFVPEEFEPDDPTKFLALLGVESPQGPFFKSWYQFLKAEGLSTEPSRYEEPEDANDVTPPSEFDLADSEYETATSRPWRTSDFPRVARWLESNDSQIEKIIEATLRKQFYAPVTARFLSPSLLMPCISISREGARALKCRAMNRFAEGRGSDAIEDLIAGHRLARLVGQSPFVVENLVAIGIDGVFYESIQTILSGNRLSQELIVELRSRLASLPPMPPMSRAMDVGQRLTTLELICQMARESRMPSGENVVASDDDMGTQFLWLGLRRGRIDWDIPLTAANHWCDQVVSTGSHQTVQRKEAIRDLEANFSGWSIDHSISSGFLNTNGVSSGDFVAAQLSPLVVTSIGICYNAEGRGEAYRQMALLAYDVILFRQENGAYPATLEQLIPKYRAEIPIDEFNNQPLEYRLTEDGFRIFMLGANGVEEPSSGENADIDTDDVGLSVEFLPTAAPAQ